MNLESQVVSLELAKRLKELGVKQKSIFEYHQGVNTHVEIICENKTYRVPRHYIALHGVNACDLDSLGFAI